MRRLAIMGLMAVVLLAGCGGDAITGQTTASTATGTTGATGSTTVAAISVSASPTSIASDGSMTSTITALAKDANNNLVSDATVAFGSTAGVLQITQATTDASGQALATITAGGAAAGTSITVNASSGTVKGSVAVAVVATQQTIVLTTSLPQIPSDSSKPATITAQLLNASNQLVPNVVVNFTASAGGALSTAPPTTGADGTASATSAVTTTSTTSAVGIATAILTPSSKATQIVTVTATAGSAMATLPVSVTGTSLLLVGPSSLTSTSPPVSYTVSLTDSSTAGIANQNVTLTSAPATGITFSPASVVTDSTGKATVTVTPGAVGIYSLKATAFGGLNVGSAPITVSAQQFQITPAASASTKVDLVGSPVTATSYPTSQTLTVTWTANSGAAVVGQAINFSTTRGTFGPSGTAPDPAAVNVLTNTAGQASATVYSTVAGPATVTAAATDPTTLTAVTTNTSIDFVATVPSAIAVQSSPATIATLGQSTITAVVRDAGNNVVEGQTVDFSNSTDVSKGTLSVASAVTDDQGRAQTVYTASSNTSATNGVVIVAEVAGTNVTSSADLTVGGLTVFLSLGTGNKVGENGSQTQFTQPYSVQAVDAAGNPVPNVPITLTIRPLVYAKGGYILGATSWVQTGTPPTSSTAGSFTPVTSCPNEDATSAYGPAQFNGVLDPGEDGCDPSGKDDVTGLLVVSPYSCNALGNGSISFVPHQNTILDPGGTAIASPSSVTTSASGSADFSVIYPEDQALWVEVELIATASASGTESTASSKFVLPMLSTYLTTTTSNPPGDPSPYGIATSCTNPF